MKKIFFIGLFTICVLTSNAQNFRKLGIPDKNQIPNNNLTTEKFTLTKLNLIDDKYLLKKNLFFRDTTSYSYLAFNSKISDASNTNSDKKPDFNNSSLIDNFLKIKFQRIPELGFSTRNLLLKDTDAPIKLIN